MFGGLRHLFITSSDSHFFNNTDFKEYIFQIGVYVHATCNRDSVAKIKIYLPSFASDRDNFLNTVNFYLAT